MLAVVEMRCVGNVGKGLLGAQVLDENGVK